MINKQIVKTIRMTQHSWRRESKEIEEIVNAVDRVSLTLKYSNGTSLLRDTVPVSDTTHNNILIHPS